MLVDGLGGGKGQALVVDINQSQPVHRHFIVPEKG
jgi:hypothetical protein